MSADGKGPSPRQGEISPEEREAFRRRSEALGKRLGDVKKRRQPVYSGDDERARGQSFGNAFHFAAEMVVGVAVGGFIGWVLDRALGTTPWLLVLFVALGFAAAMLNIIRAAQKAQAEAEASQLAAPSVADEDEDN